MGILETWVSEFTHKSPAHTMFCAAARELDISKEVVITEVGNGSYRGKV